MLNTINNRNTTETAQDVDVNKDLPTPKIVTLKSETSEITDKIDLSTHTKV